MKKAFLFMTALVLAGATVNAQSKEELKAQKEAQKAADKVLKEAKLAYDMSIPNAQYGRKETDFDRMQKAVDLIGQAMANPLTASKEQTWEVAANIEAEYNKKIENEVKVDETLQPKYAESCSKIVYYCMKYDSLMNINPKVKGEEKKLNHVKFQNMAVNPAIQLLQAAQNYSNSENKDDLKLGAKYGSQFIYTMEQSSLMKDFTNASLDDWKTYAKAFYAQSLFGLPDTPEDKLVAAYENLMATRYKAIACQSLANYYREKDQAKQNLYLKKGIDILKGDAEQADLRASFAVMLLQNQFQAKQYDEFLQTANLMKEEMSGHEHTINAYLMEGQMLFENQKYDEAEATFMAAKPIYPDEPKCLLMAARCAWMKAQSNGSKKPDMDHAIELFKQLEAENPSDSELWGESLYILYNNTNQPKLAANYKKYYKN